MAQTPTRTPLQYAPETPRVDWVKYALFAATAVLLVVGVMLLWPRNDTPGPAPAPPAATNTAPTAEQQAKADTERVFRAWLANYSLAARTFDSAQLDPSLATPDVISAAKADFDALRGPAAGVVTGTYSADIRDIVVGYYTSDRVTLTVCALRDARFIKDGRDVTVTRDGKPAPLATQPMWQATEFIRVGDVWKVSAFELDTEQGTPCQ
jgi:hypothetical protein